MVMIGPDDNELSFLAEFLTKLALYNLRDMSNRRLAIKQSQVFCTRRFREGRSSFASKNLNETPVGNIRCAKQQRNVA